MSPETLAYQADGLDMRGQLFIGAGQGARPGVLVFPEAYGLGEHAISRARRLAEAGYAALACDLLGQGRTVATLEQAIAEIGVFRNDPVRLRVRAGGALDALIARPEVDASRVAAIGFCIGGTLALELARAGRPIAAAVGFHAGLATGAPAKTIAAKILVCIGADDPMIDAAQRAAFEAEMCDARADWQMHLYGGVVHSFTNPHASAVNSPAVRYDAQADARSWAAMTTLFAETLANPS